jgi:DNA repair protein SbcC/Rad50
MNIESLRLKGFIGIKRGLGLDEIEVDFRNTAGLVAFAGSNGLGKSTILENLHPYNTLASRSGALFNHVCRRDAEKELSFAYNGSRYRTLLKIDAQSGKSEGFIWKNGESLVNGKIRDYAKKINEIFGSENLFFNSVFCSQNATKLSDMTTGQLKSLFAEFLRLDRLQGYEETAKQVINVLTGKVSQIDVNLQAFQNRLESVTATKDEISRLMLLKAEQKSYKADATDKLQDNQVSRDKLKETIARNEVLCKQSDEMRKILANVEDARDKEGYEAEQSLAKLRAQYQQLTREIAEADGILSGEAAIHAHAENKKAVEELIESISASLEHMADEVTAAQKTVTELEKDVQEHKNRLKQTENDATLADINRDISVIKQQIIACNNQMAALDKRHPECTIGGCSFIVSALQAQEELPVLNDRLKQLQISRENRTTELEAVVNEIIAHIAEKESALKQFRVRLNELITAQSAKRQELAIKRRELSQYQNVAEKQAALAVAKSKKEDRLKALEENKTQGQSISEAWNTKKAALDDQIAEQRKKLAAIKIDTSAVEELKAIEKEIQIVSESIKTTETAIADTSTKIDTLQGELSGMQEAEEQLRKTNEDKIRVNADIADWTYIKNACGKNGLQAMEIDGAAPIITGFANDLLSRAFGSLYTVKFRTQDDEGKECLDIITITDDGEEVLLDNLSGGQRVWILMALRLAMTLLSKEKGGRNFQTAFFDEMDGALDSDNAVNFVNLYKSFMDIGHFETIPFISHKPECRSMADHVLMFEAGKNPYWN